MVFESVLTQVLNSVLGDYVENLDRNQLNIGIWGGDVSLKNLILKQGALDELDLPIQTVYGRIGKLVLKIPWKNLYGAAFEINVEDIYLLAEPNLQVKYDPIKEDNNAYEAKQKEIKKIEEAKKLELEKDLPKADFTFVEKLITQIIKNMQLTIKNIHIRYEDKITSPGKPFALGITLSALNVVSTDENWKPAITKENISKIFKIVKLEGLAVYWNCLAQFYGSLPAEDFLHKLQSEIVSKEKTPENYSYILGPINASARLKMNQKPELDSPPFTIPKILLNLDMEKLGVCISKSQYQDVIALADSMARMSRGVPYRKYRPDVPSYKNHYKEWWHFAYTCILEGEVRRIKRNWDWSHISEHRLLCKNYGALYQKKLTNSAKAEDLAQLKDHEKKLDIYNIVIIRQRIELETERLNRKVQSTKKASWFGWMWGSSPDSTDQDTMKNSTAILKQFEAAMTPEEKAKLYKALDYQENAAPAQYPTEYVDNSCTFLLRTLEIELRDDTSKVMQRVLFMELKGVKCKLDTRPAESAIRVNAKIDDFSIYGLEQDDGFIPNVISSETEGKDTGLLEVTFETNPLDGKCDKRLHLFTQPLVVIYDAVTIIRVIDIFKIPNDAAIDELSVAAGSGLTNIKEKSATGLQYAIDTHSKLDLNINLKAPYVIVPFGGKYTGSENVLVINLGHLHIYTVEQHRLSVFDLRTMHREGVKEKEIMEEMISQSYDQFNLNLTDIQILMAQGSEDWKTSLRGSKVSNMHLLNPVSLNIVFHKCLITDDPRLPLNKVTAALPCISVNVSDARLLLLVALGTSIPLPTSDLPENTPLQKFKSAGSSMVLSKWMDLQETTQKTKTLLPTGDTSSKQDFQQFTTLDVKFVMSELNITLSHQETVESILYELVALKLKALECDLTQQTYNLSLSLRLKNISLQYIQDSGIIDLIRTPSIKVDEDYLFKVKFIQVDKKSPEFHSVYKSCETTLTLNFGMLNITLHQESLLSLMQFATSLQMQADELTRKPAVGVDRIATTDEQGLKRRLSTISEALSAYGSSKEKDAKKKKGKRRVVVETIKFKLSAELQEVTIKFSTMERDLSSCSIQGIKCDLIIKNSYTHINAKLSEIIVIDLNPETCHSLILSGLGGEALDAQIVISSVENSELDKPDIVVEIVMGGLRIVFLNWFVSSMLNFLNQFETARQTIIDASQAAAQTAKENMKNVYEKATKISLNIRIKAPDIIVPVNSKSYDAILLDLGFIELNNLFLTLDIKNQEDHPVVIDELKLNLSELKLSRIKLNNKNEMICECTLLEPFECKMIIKRNLSTSWYRGVPDLNLSGKIELIKLTISRADYHTLMYILSGNLAEGRVVKKTDNQNVDKVDDGPGQIVSAKPSVTTFVNISRESSSPALSKADVEGSVYIFLKFQFTMEKLIINLFSGGSKSLSRDSSLHSSDAALSQFALHGLSIKGRLLSDNSISTSILLINCIVDDTRKGNANKLNRLIQRTAQDSDDTLKYTSSDSVSAPRSMVDLTFQMKEDDMFLDIRIYSFTVILSVDYVLNIGEFFQVPQEPSETYVKGTKITQMKAKAITPVPKKESQLTVNIKLEKPDIILVEHMNNIDTHAMILNSEIMIKFRMSGDHQVVSGTIKDLQLYRCCYDPTKRAETRSNVLHPVTISLAGSTPENKGLHLELLITNVHIGVSPATIELINNILVTLSTPTANPDDEEEKVPSFANIWNPRTFADTEFWFLKTDAAQEAFEGHPFEASPRVTKLDELCIISMPSLVLTIEAGVGNKTLPMLLLETSFKGSVHNWSSQLSVEASLTMVMGYFNSRLALWEPLIEPVEVIRANKSLFVPWELKMEVTMNEQEDTTSPTSEYEAADVPVQQPVMSIDVSSDANLEITVTKTCLEVIKNLCKAFASAMKRDATKAKAAGAPYKFINEIGIPVTVLLEESSFQMYPIGGPTEALLENTAQVPLNLKKNFEKGVNLKLRKELNTTIQSIDHILTVRINDKNCTLNLPVVRADKRFFMLNYRGDSHDNWGIISDIKLDEGVTLITLRSILQVYNHFNIPIEVYYMTPKGNELESVATVQPGSEVNLPLNAVYTPTNELFFSVQDYSVTTTPYIWKDLQTNLSITKLLQCTPKNNSKGTESFIIQAVGEMEQVYYENTTRHTMASTCYNIHLRPAVVLKNCIPLDIICCMEEIMEEVAVKAGDVHQLPNVEPGKSAIVIRIPEYLEKEWSCRGDVYVNAPEFSVWTFNSYDSPTKMALDLGMHTVNKNGSIVMTLYCPFWMLNKTGLMIGYRNSDENLNVLHHPPNFKGPILFSFNAKNFFGKKKACIRVEQGEWSDKFSLDVAGSSGVVVCKANERLYQVGVHNQLTYNGLTKQVTFTPYYVIINNAPFKIECQESDRPADPWLEVEPKSCSALWPRSDLEDKLLKLRVVDEVGISSPFLYTESHTTLLKLNNKYGGINVDIQMTEGAVYINMAAYDLGMAPALIINHTKDTMNFWEKESVQIRKLKSRNCMLYTWENPSGPRILVWEKGQKKEIENDLRKDSIGEYSVGTYDVYWASFLDGMQRVLVFTQERSIVEGAQSAKLFEQIQQEITVSIQGLGLSLVNNFHRQELIYIGIASSGVIWEQCKLTGRRYKHLGTKDSTHLENAYQQYLLRGSTSNDDSDSIIIDNKYEIDFKNQRMLKPNKRKIRRVFQTGLWFQMKTSPSQTQLHAKVNRLQIDNQMYDCIFPVVLAPVMPPKSVAIDSGIKPFVEVSIVQLLMKNSQIKQFKYFKVLVQEFHIKVDLGFVNALVEIFENEAYSDEDEKQLFLTDMKLVDEVLYSHASTQSLQEQKSFYDLLHFSPLKIHVSFSMAAGTSAGQSAATPNFINVLLQGLGVTLTDLQDVIFKLAYFEREYTFLTQRQLTSEAISHYVGQSVKQLYVLVLGLDVLGNPYGLVLGITKGVEDLFYEPFQGAIQGPGEFAEGLVLGVRSLFGHTVGGAAGAVSRITGAMGKGIAALTFDKDYQRKRRDQINKKPATVQEGIARSGKGLVMGVVDGVTGVFTKPISGAKEQGVEGFFKGLGKGAVGLVARPTAGVIDFASGSLDAVKRATEVGEEANKLRPARFLHGDGLVRPYNRQEANGNKLLVDLEKGKYASTDVYVHHQEIINKKEVLLLTDQRLAYITHNDIFGGWQIDWAYTWSELPHPAKVVPKGVTITTSEKKKKLFGSSDSTKTILIADPAKREFICEKIESLREIN